MNAAEANDRKHCHKLQNILIAVDVLIPKQGVERKTYSARKCIQSFLTLASTSTVRNSFIGPIHPDMTLIHGLMNEAKVEGIGHVRWHVKTCLESDNY